MLYLLLLIFWISRRKWGAWMENKQNLNLLITEWGQNRCSLFFPAKPRQSGAGSNFTLAAQVVSIFSPNSWQEREHGYFSKCQTVPLNKPCNNPLLSQLAKAGSLLSSFYSEVRSSSPFPVLPRLCSRHTDRKHNNTERN